MRVQRVVLEDHRDVAVLGRHRRDVAVADADRRRRRSARGRRASAASSTCRSPTGRRARGTHRRRSRGRVRRRRDRPARVDARRSSKVTVATPAPYPAAARVVTWGQAPRRRLGEVLAVEDLADAGVVEHGAESASAISGAIDSTSICGDLLLRRQRQRVGEHDPRDRRSSSGGRWPGPTARRGWPSPTPRWRRAASSSSAADAIVPRGVDHVVGEDAQAALDVADAPRSPRRRWPCPSAGACR